MALWWLLQELSIVEGDFVVQNNNNLASLMGTAQSLEIVSGQVEHPNVHYLAAITCHALQAMLIIDKMITHLHVLICQHSGTQWAEPNTILQSDEYDEYNIAVR